MKPRILVISREYRPMIAGVSKYISEIMERVKAEKTIVAFKFGERNDSNIVEVEYPGFAKKRVIRALCFVTASILKSLGRDYDVIVGNAFIGSVAGVVLKLMSGKPLVSIVYDVDFLGRDTAEYGKVNKFIRKRGIGAILALSDKVVVDSDKVGRDITKFYGTSREKITTIPCGITHSTGFEKLKKTGKKIILFVGNVAEKKGLTDLAHAMKIVVKSYGKVELWLVGPDNGPFAPYMEKLGKLVRELRIDRNVKFVGVVKNVEPYYQVCDILVLPSQHSEGFGLPIAEAARFGKPCVATRIFKETGVVNEKTGVVVPAKSPEKLADAILKLMKDKKLCRKLGRNAEKFSKRFDWEASAKRFEKVVMELI